jgi:Pyruvate/2-oxoacid:ferredoxin oxidoreductase gamma subunit
LEERINTETLLLGEKNVCADELQNKNRFFDMPFTKLASDIGNTVYLNMVATGALVGVISISSEMDCLDTIAAYRICARGKEIVTSRGVKFRRKRVS